MVIQSFLVVTGLTDVRLPLYAEVISAPAVKSSVDASDCKKFRAIIKTSSRMWRRRADQERRFTASDAMLANYVCRSTGADAVYFNNSINITF